MAREKKETYVIIAPKNESGKKKMDYHGERWVLRGVSDTVRFTVEKGPWLTIRSRDGTKCLHVKQHNDPDFDVRVLQ